MNKSEKKRGKSTTAAELLKKLENDPIYQDRLQANEDHKKQAIAEFMQSVTPIFEELSQSGYVLEDFSDLHTRKVFANKKTFHQVIPILLRWLSQIDNVDVKESIVRTLSVKWAKPIATPGMIDEFKRVSDPDSSYKWAIGNALSVVADDSVFEDIVKLVQDKKHGRAREMVAVALGNMKNPRAVDVLIELLEDEEVAGHALIALRKLKAKKARPYIERFLDHPKTWVRNEAKKALAKLEV